MVNKIIIIGKMTSNKRKKIITYKKVYIYKLYNTQRIYMTSKRLYRNKKRIISI